MDERILLVGFDTPEVATLSDRLPFACISHELAPRIVVERGQLFVQSSHGDRYLRVSRVIFHGIFENDLDFLAGLALWGGPCFPNAVAMMNCRLRLPCLVHALRLTRFGGQRGYASPRAEYEATAESVAKWGNWHCGENKERFVGTWIAREPTLFEPFVAGEAIRVIILGDEARQIRLTGQDWRKSVHGAGAEFMPADPALVADTETVRKGLGLDIIANDYMVSSAGPYLLEVNHIPSVTCFPELWQEYLDVVTNWVNHSALAVSRREEHSDGVSAIVSEVAGKICADAEVDRVALPEDPWKPECSGRTVRGIREVRRDQPALGVGARLRLARVRQPPR